MAREPMEARTWIAMVVGACMAAPAPALAVMVPGGGPTSTDCYAELEVMGAEPGTVQRGRKIVCRDGDPCDAGPCGDAVCDVTVRLCWNQRDPDLPACVPPPALDAMSLRGQLGALLVMPEHMTDGGCTDALTIPVPTTHDGTRPGRLTTRIRARAAAGTVPPVDADTVRIVCMPRPFDECPMPTTTTVPGATTTTVTTTRPGPTATTSTSTTTTTTLRRPRKTTTTRRPTTTTSSTTSTTAAPPTTTAPPSPTTTTTTTVAVPTTEPTPTTLVVTTTTDTTTTTRRKKGGGDNQDLVLSVTL